MNETIKTMIDQFGGNQSFRMIGAKNLGYSNKDNSLSFKFMRNGSKATMCQIVYSNAMDDYTIKFYTCKANLIETFSGLFCTDLRSTFSEYTGLTLTMPRVVGINC